MIIAMSIRKLDEISQTVHIYKCETLHKGVHKAPFPYDETRTCLTPCADARPEKVNPLVLPW